MRKMGNWKPISRTTGSSFPPPLALFLRPGIHFHHGRELEMRDVIASLERRTLPLYSHIAHRLPTAWTLDIHLSQPDAGCPGCWACAAMILPRSGNR
jgi:MarR-like DNA-binding transcriptional regulator SgrR of sgrS sRNA